jgi:4-hydroxy-tetrahydrodipicolinate reductase
MSAPALRVAVVGARGRMGRFACELLRATPGFEVAAEIEREHRLEGVLRECGAGVGLDLTVAGLGARHARCMLEVGLRPVVGTSGVTRAEVGELDRLARARDLGGIVVPNFSLGMACLQRAAEELVRHFASVEILELHHERKKDAPSGTARHTAERLERLRGGAAVPIHSVRLPGLYAHQEVFFGGPGETLTLRHDMTGPEAFGPGLLAALRFAARARGVALGLDAALAPASS